MDAGQRRLEAWRRPATRAAAVAMATTTMMGATLVGLGVTSSAAAAPAPDSSLVPLDERWGDDTTNEGIDATLKTGSWLASLDQGSAFTVTRDTGAQTVWGKQDPNNSTRKLTGHGVGVALIDTGVARVAGLDGAGKVVNGPDLSLDSQAANLRYADGYGHGTHMAGLIAGRDSTAPRGNENDEKWFVGMAPDAKIVNVKVGAADGSVDVSQVIAGIDWVVANRASHNIRVLNLSYGTDSTQSHQLDPLAHAVENAWRAASSWSSPPVTTASPGPDR